MSAKDKKKGASVPRLRFPEFRDAGEWEKIFLGEYSEVVRGGSPRPIDNFLTAERDGLNWLKIGDINKEAKYVVATTEKVRAEALSKTREISPGDLILSNSMSFGRPYISKIKTCIHDGWIAITEISKKLHVEYIYYLISSPFSQQYFTSNAAGSGVQNLNSDIIKSLPIFFPNIFEQQRIADCLSSLDERIAAETNKLDALKAHKKGLLKQLFPAEGETLPQLRFPEFRDVGEWKKITLYNICDILPGYTFPEVLQGKQYGQYPFCKVSDISKAISDDGGLLHRAINYVDSADLSILKAKPIPIGTTVFAKIGEALRLNRRAISTMECLIDNNAVGIKAKPGKSINYFLYILSQRIDLNEYCGGAVPSVSKTVLENIAVVIPTCSEQQRIADCLSFLDELIAAQTQKINLLKDHKKGLMQQLFPRIDEVRA